MLKFSLIFEARDPHNLIADRITVGRLPDNVIAISDESVSGHHAELVKEDGKYRLRDLASANGTTVNGAPISEVVLADGDSISFGASACRFRSATEIKPALDPALSSVWEWIQRRPAKVAAIFVGLTLALGMVKCQSMYRSARGQSIAQGREAANSALAHVNESLRELQKTQAIEAKQREEQAHVAQQHRAAEALKQADEKKQREERARQDKERDQRLADARKEQQRTQKEKDLQQSQEREQKRLAGEMEKQQVKEQAAAALRFPPPCFAAFKWEDGLFDLVLKARSIRGVKSIVLSSGWDVELVDALNIANVSKRIEEAIKKNSGDQDLLRSLSIPAVRTSDLSGIGSGTIVGGLDVQNLAQFNRYDTPLGKDTLLFSTRTFEKTFDLVVSPVIINGCPFVLKFSLIPRPEMAFARSQSCIYFPEGRCALPLAIKEIELESDSDVIPSVWRGIYQKAKEKYGNANFKTHSLFQDDTESLIGVKDGSASTLDDKILRFGFEIRCYVDREVIRKPEIKITYTSDLYLTKLAEDFRLRQADTERQKNHVGAKGKGL